MKTGRSTGTVDTGRHRARLPFPSPSDILTPTVAALTAGVFVALGLLAAFADGNLLF